MWNLCWPVRERRCEGDTYDGLNTTTLPWMNWRKLCDTYDASNNSPTPLQSRLHLLLPIHAQGDKDCAVKSGIQADVIWQPRLTAGTSGTYYKHTIRLFTHLDFWFLASLVSNIWTSFNSQFSHAGLILLLRVLASFVQSVDLSRQCTCHYSFGISSWHNLLLPSLFLQNEHYIPLY